MRSEVRARFVPFTARFEGVLPHMYLDVENLVTCAIGNLIDSVSAALSCPWVHVQSVIGAQYGAGGPLPATVAEVTAEWHYVKSRTDLSQRGGGAYGEITHLRLTDEGITHVVAGKLDDIDRHLAARYPFWETLPANAQLAVLSMSWAEGPAFKAPKFDAALAKREWAVYEDDADGVPVLVGGCAKECHLSDLGNPGLRPRNAANAELFMSLNIAASSLGLPLDQQNVALPAPEFDGPVANEAGVSDTDEGRAA